MEELILEHQNGVERLAEDTLIIAFDDTGQEKFADPDYPVFGLGGCGFLVRDYTRLIELPWNFMCQRFFSKFKRPLHATDIGTKLSEEQLGALKHFFEKFEFFRIATTASIKTRKKIDIDFIQIIGNSLLNRICDIGKWVKFNRLIMVFEESERIEIKVLQSLSGKKIITQAKEIEIELALMRKSAAWPPLEIADFIIHTAGAQTKHRISKDSVVRKDFEIIFRNVDKRLTSFMEITDVKSK